MGNVVRMNGLVRKGTLPDGTAVEVSAVDLPLPATVWIRPAVGDTVSYWHSCDGGTTYTLRGAVTAYTEDVLDSGVSHLKFQRTAGSGTTSAYGVS